jgi:hypothetical protein
VIDCYSCSHNSEQGADADNCLASNDLLENEDFILKCGSWQAEACFTGTWLKIKYIFNEKNDLFLTKISGHDPQRR